MNLQYIKIGLAQILAVSLIGCALVKDEPALDERLAEYGYRPGESVEAVDDYQVTDWQYLDDRHLIFSNNNAEHYLLSLRKNCTALRSAEQLAFKPISDALTRIDDVIASNSEMLSRCAIETISMVYPSE
ncbi:MAG: hypothetical protein ACI8RU_002923 [Zhongshania aliphaticivorans]|jgi:hypothetical protein|uniref:DUF6491 family protein n=1 Tax=Zhongshania aliphaticivorans TaxID=1470434 RepID=UPI0039E58B2F|tara:strand:- start:2071 stop:2460 length:390 start_codon:yes stop_codon:yes gene_type:complete